MTTVTYKNIDNKSFKQVKDIVESELNLSDDLIIKETKDVIVYSYKIKEFLTSYKLELSLFKDIKTRIKIDLACISSSMRLWIWLTLPLFVFTGILWFIHSVTSNISRLLDKYSLKESLDKHFL